MFQSIISIILALLLINSFSLLSAFAADSKTVTSGSCGEHAKWALYDNGTLVISGTGQMENYTNEKWKAYSNHIKSIIIEPGITSIGQNAFSYYLTGVETISIPDGINYIGPLAFSSCNSLKEIVIPEGVPEINYNCFSECSSLEKIILPDSITMIAGLVFSGCKSLRSIKIPKNVKNIYGGSFYNCTALEYFEVDKENQYFSSDENGVLYNKDKTVLLQFPAGNKKDEFSVPNNITSLGDTYFNAFNTSSLKRIFMTDNITSIAPMAFANCKLLTSACIPEKMSKIERSTFSKSINLSKLYIPKNVTSIMDFAFDGCDSLRDIYYSGNETEWDNIEVGQNNTALLNATVHYNHVHEYGDWTTLSREVSDNCTITLKKYRECICTLRQTKETQFDNTHKHEYKVIITNNPSCTTTGEEIYICECGDFYSETIPTTSHNYSSEVYVPSCTEVGYTVCTCENCGDTYKTAEIPASGHNYGDYEIVQEMTCTKNGIKQAMCEKCGACDKVEIPKSEHSYENGKCTQCGRNNCSHLCHNSNGFIQFIWKIVRFFCSIFNIEKTCSCGVIHY